MSLKSALPGGLLLCFVAAAMPAQDSTRHSRTDTATTATVDSADSGRLTRLKTESVLLSHRSLAVARRAERTVFGADSAVELWTRHADPASRALRKMSPVAFWVPIAAVVTAPAVWVDESQDGHRLNAQYAGGATAALAMGFVVSRTAKHFIHRARPCTGDPPGDVFVGGNPDSLAQCPRGSGVAGYTSFFSEHTMALFAIASAATFQSQRQNDPRAATIAAVAFSGASVFSIGRIYERHHWLSDVLVGAAVGTAAGWVGAQLGPAPRK